MTQAALGTSQWAVDRIRELEAEVERLKTELDNERSAYARIAAKAKARIETALALIERMQPVLPTWESSSQRLWHEVVKALKGE